MLTLYYNHYGVAQGSVLGPSLFLTYLQSMRVDDLYRSVCGAPQLASREQHAADRTAACAHSNCGLFCPRTVCKQ